MPIPVRASRRNIRADIDPLLSYFGGGGYGSAPSADLIRLFDKSALTLSGDAVTITKNYHIIAAEAGVTDDLATINGGDTGWLLAIAADSGDTITVKNGTGNIAISGGYDIALTGDRVLLLIYDGTNWIDVGPGTYTEGPGIDIAGGAGIGLGGDTILLYDSGGDPLSEYAFSDAGLTAALAAMAAGDVLELPAGTITGGPWALAHGTLRGLSREDSILDGQLTIGDATAAENLSIIRSEDDAGAIYGIVEGAGDITATLNNISVDVANATGAAYAVYMANGGRIDAYETELLAETGSAGYAVYISSGDFYHISGVARGTTALAPYFT